MAESFHSGKADAHAFREGGPGQPSTPTREREIAAAAKLSDPPGDRHWVGGFNLRLLYKP
jgi:hypothetical protein